jgi:hypothetical protein
MATVKLEKINPSGGVSLRYTVSVFDDFSFELNTPVSALPLPEETDDDNVLVKVEGNTTQITFSWLIKPETSTMVTTDDSSPLPSTVQTVNEQLRFFSNMFQPRSIDDKFRFTVDDGNDDIQKNGFYTKFSFRRTSSEVLTYRAKCNFIVGDVITVFEEDAPSIPTAVSAVAGASGALAVSWTAPASVGGSAVLSYVVMTRLLLDDAWTETASAGTGVTKTVTALTPTTAYQVRVKAVNSDGTGAPSNPIIEGTSG